MIRTMCDRCGSMVISGYSGVMRVGVMEYDICQPCEKAILEPLRGKGRFALSPTVVTPNTINTTPYNAPYTFYNGNGLDINTGIAAGSTYAVTPTNPCNGTVYFNTDGKPESFLYKNTKGEFKDGKYQVSVGTVTKTVTN